MTPYKLRVPQFEAYRIIRIHTRSLKPSPFALPYRNNDSIITSHRHALQPLHVTARSHHGCTKSRKTRSIDASSLSFNALCSPPSLQQRQHQHVANSILSSALCHTILVRNIQHARCLLSVSLRSALHLTLPTIRTSTRAPRSPSPSL